MNLSIAEPEVQFECEPPVVTATRSDGMDLDDPFPPGQTTITWNAQDDGGSASPANQEVMIASATIVAKKFYDENANGLDDDGLVVAGWPITLSGTDSMGNDVVVTEFTDGSGLATFSGVPLGSYAVTEDHPGGGWVATTAESVNVSVDDCTEYNVHFGNRFFAPDEGIQINKTLAAPKAAVPGAQVSWSVVVTSHTLAGAQNVMTTDTVPSVVTGVAVGGPNGGSCLVAGQVVTCDFGTIPYLAVRSYTITGALAPDFTGDLANTVQVTTSSIDVNPDDNTSTSTKTAMPQADLSVEKSDGNTSVQAPAVISYTITVRNEGPSDVPSAAVSDVLPVALQDPMWTCAAFDGATCTAGPVAGDIADNVVLPAGSSVVYTVSGTIASAFSGNLSNTATVSSAVPDGNPGNNSATDDTDVEPSPAAPAPALSSWGLLLSVLLLIALAALRFRASGVLGSKT